MSRERGEQVAVMAKNDIMSLKHTMWTTLAERSKPFALPLLTHFFVIFFFSSGVLCSNTLSGNVDAFYDAHIKYLYAWMDIPEL